MVAEKQKISSPDFRQIVVEKLDGRSVYWLAKVSGVPQSRLATWLAGKQATISSAYLARVFAALGVRCR